MKRSTAGFTIIELLFVILIGSILTVIALQGFQNVQSRFAVESAKRTYMTWHQRARSRAVETGETVIMVVYTQGDSVAMVTGSPTSGFQFDEIQRFDQELGVRLRTRNDFSFYMCMTPRGYADVSCGSWGAINPIFQATFSDTVRLWFQQSADTAGVLILPMGQVIG